jgi:hypothetical protein
MKKRLPTGDAWLAGRTPSAAVLPMIVGTARPTKLSSVAALA